MKYLLPALFLLSTCASPPPSSSSQKLDITMRNRTPYPIEIQAKAGIFSRSIRLLPGEKWTGWVPTFVSVQGIEIEMVEDARK
jgi:hypothetical protein